MKCVTYQNDLNCIFSLFNHRQPRLNVKTWLKLCSLYGGFALQGLYRGKTDSKFYAYIIMPTSPVLTQNYRRGLSASFLWESHSNLSMQSESQSDSLHKFWIMPPGATMDTMEAHITCWANKKTLTRGRERTIVNTKYLLCSHKVKGWKEQQMKKHMERT